MKEQTMRPSTAFLKFIPLSATTAAFLVLASFFQLPVAISGTPSENPAAAPPEVGIWYDDTKQGAVRISQCGQKLCGHIVWLEKPLNDEGVPLYDKYNPDESKNKRLLCGMQILGDLATQQDGTYDNGWVYDPKVGHTFNVAINLIDESNLHVRGYAKLKIFGQSFTWTRAPQDLEPCAK